MHCKPGGCILGSADEGGYTEVVLPTKTLKLPGCPLVHKDVDTQMWVGLYNWRKNFGTSPITEGVVNANRLDPRYFDVMELIEWHHQQRENSGTARSAGA